MKIGVKTFNNRDFLKQFEDRADFFEVMAIETNNYDFLKEFKLPIVIHSPHGRFGINPADKTKIEKNLSSIDFSRKIADQTNAKKIIYHPGDLENENCSIEQAVSFVKSLDDKRIIIENIPVENKMKRLCQTPEETKEFLKATGKGFCFDINHAIWTAIAKKIDYLDFIKEFIKLKPKHYHIGGQIIKDNSTMQEKKEHLALRDSDFNLKEILESIPKDAEITLETTTNIDKTMDDVNIMKEWVKELGK